MIQFLRTRAANRRIRHVLAQYFRFLWIVLDYDKDNKRDIKTEMCLHFQLKSRVQMKMGSVICPLFVAGRDDAKIINKHHFLGCRANETYQDEFANLTY